MCRTRRDTAWSLSQEVKNHKVSLPPSASKLRFLISWATKKLKIPPTRSSRWSYNAATLRSASLLAQGCAWLGLSLQVPISPFDLKAYQEDPSIGLHLLAAQGTLPIAGGQRQACSIQANEDVPARSRLACLATYPRAVCSACDVCTRALRLAPILCAITQNHAVSCLVNTWVFL